MSHKQFIIVQGRVREVHAQFENYILYKTNGDVKGINPHAVTFCDQAGNPLPEEIQEEIKGEKVVQATAQISSNNEKPNVVKVKIGNNNALFNGLRQKSGQEMTHSTVDSDAPEDGSKIREENKPTVTYNLNTINTEEEIRQVAQAVSGLGYKTLKTIVVNRPASGYQDLDHLRTENINAIPKNLKWSAMEEYLEF
jgi:hypothetical protein